ncbi:hypothetical protein [Fredinandcohnia sp. 179-A 10B2 NHS]|uniref:hypothetical protein n=1 Tax=Fredinandcohnia sp. 179-A 10B2 NHS TaxID=3235176 RepID=UPI00399FC261
MKLVKILLVFVIVLGGIGFGVYYFGTNLASEKLMDTIASELENNGEMEQIKTVIESDPALVALLEDAKHADTSTLPFTTKEEATRVLVKKVGITELNEIRTKAQDGSMTQEELLAEVETKLSEEEILALKVLAYKEIYGE